MDVVEKTQNFYLDNRFFAVTSQDLKFEAGGFCKPGDLDLKRMSECCTWRQFRCVETSAKSKMQTWAVELAEASSGTAVPPGFYTLI